MTNTYGQVIMNHVPYVYFPMSAKLIRPPLKNHK